MMKFGLHFSIFQITQGPNDRKTEMLIDWEALRALTAWFPSKVLGKGVECYLEKDDKWMVFGNSHLTLMSEFLRTFGAGTAAIRGGGISHVHELLRLVKFFKGGIECIFLLATGNDLANLNKPCSEIALEMHKMIRELKQDNPLAVVVTISAIPRIPGDFYSVENSDKFLERIGLLDRMMIQQDDMHHHLKHDYFVGERTDKGTLPLREFYIRDHVHLNFRGREALQELFKFAFDCVNFHDFDRYGTIWINHYTGDKRFAKWAF